MMAHLWIRKPLMADAEAWAVIAEVIDGARDCFNKHSHLCQMLVQFAREGTLEPYQWLRMEQQLYKYRKVISRGRKHFWPLGEITPRVEACRRLYKLVFEEIAKTKVGE